MSQLVQMRGLLLPLLDGRPADKPVTEQDLEYLKSLEKGAAGGGVEASEVPVAGNEKGSTTSSNAAIGGSNSSNSGTASKQASFMANINNKEQSRFALTSDTAGIMAW